MRIRDWSSDVCASDLHVAERAGEVDDGSAALHGAGHAAGVAHVAYHELRLAEAAERLQEGRGAGLTLCDADAGAACEQPLHDIAAEEAPAAQHRDQLPVEFLHCVRLYRFSGWRGARRWPSPCREAGRGARGDRSEGHTSELQSLM